MAVLIERARAKINLTLRVRGRRADGYHDLDSLVAFAALADRLALEPGPGIDLVVSGPRAAACGPAADNLVLVAAAQARARIAGLILGRFTLDKRLPAAAGIGGGSADAAAALRLIARANALSPDDSRLMDAARATGADVPVCLVSRASRMRGIGDELQPVAWPRIAAVLVNPGVAVATRDVFGALGLKAGETLAADENMNCAPLTPTGLAAGRNDLEPVAVGLQPVIGDVLAALRATGCVLARMSGSGATCFSLYADGRSALSAAHALRRAHPAWWVRASVIG
ncbi:MAG: 4-(cytidine 5'-diphospho)-2-C-methyl-D-erythritol kinase [Xanthobacteraceae bacterium]|nr:MAG: 4-(cytidine 5'-diphospho)-2-C-methyl-D-erythritol kinase [Xanthobacteraceae bacterium]